MKLFTLAIASIVDANTGYGLVHNNHRLDYHDAVEHGRNIRAASIHTLLLTLKRALGRVIADYRDRRRQRRQAAKLLQLNDHLLRDIGFTRADLTAAQFGAVSLDQLNRNRGAAHLAANTLSCRYGNIGASDGTQTAANEAVFITDKCA